jgi:hypothetical protein
MKQGRLWGVRVRVCTKCLGVGAPTNPTQPAQRDQQESVVLLLERVCRVGGVFCKRHAAALVCESVGTAGCGERTGPGWACVCQAGVCQAAAWFVQLRAVPPCVACSPV